MTAVIFCLFLLTYVGMALGRLPGLSLLGLGLDRMGIALGAALLLVISGALPGEQARAAVDVSTLLLLAALMMISSRLALAGLYQRLAAAIAAQTDRPHRLLALTIALGGLLSALLINDIVVFALTPVLCDGLLARQRDPRPYLLALAAASNAGSAASLIGNPQNILIGQVGQLDFGTYSLIATVPALASLLLIHLVISRIWRASLQPTSAGTTTVATMVTPLSAVDRVETRWGLAAVGLLLVLFLTPMPRVQAALLVAGALLLRRSYSSRQLLAGIDLSLLILIASLFIINEALAHTGLPQALLADWTKAGWAGDRLAFLLPFSLLASNSIGNVPAVMLLLEIWPTISHASLTALAILTTLSGNLLLMGSLANLIVAERAASAGVTLRFQDHARAGLPLTLLTLLVAVAWLWGLGLLPM